MTLDEFLAISGNKYLVIGKAVWEQDELAKTVAPDPRHFSLNGTDYTIVSLEPLAIPDLIAYMESQEGQYEFGWTQGNGKASYLTHEQVLELVALVGEESDEVNA